MATEKQIAHVWDVVSSQGVELLTQFGLKLLGAVVLWVVGRFIIRYAVRIAYRVLFSTSKFDVTLRQYMQTVLSVLLNILLLLAVLSVFGIQTTSFAALLAGAGLAIGTAWAGLLAHFAAGVFLQVLRPFKVGDLIEAAGVQGTVVEVGLFATTVQMPDNVKAIVANNKLFSDNIINYTETNARRIECMTKVAHSVDALEAVEKLRHAVQQLPNVLQDPAPQVEVFDFTLEGTVLCVRPFAMPEHYGQVYFDTRRMVVQTFSEAGYPPPEVYQVERKAETEAEAEVAREVKG